MSTMPITSDINKEQKMFQRYFNKALHFQSLNNIQLAIEFYDRALHYNNNHLPTLQVLGFLSQQSGQYEKAIQYYSHASELHSHSATLQNSLGLCYERCKQWHQAKKHYTSALELRQDYAEALNNLGNICRKMGEYQQAEFSLLRSLRIQISVPTLINLGLLMAEMHNFSQAHSFYDHALRLQPFNNEIKWHKALLLLSEGEFKQGWELYSVGSNSTNINSLHTTNISDTEIYCQPKDFVDKHVYIKGKQNINDEIMFASCLPEVIKLTKSCRIECDDRLVTIFQRSFNDAEIISKTEAEHHQLNNTNPIDLTISLVNIARCFRQSFNDFPSEGRYLQPSIQKTNYWVERFEQINHGLKVGIAWRTNTTDEVANNYCSLEEWKSIFQGTNSKLINLQYGQIQNELDKFGVDVLDWSDTDHQHNIEKLAAEIEALDLVITSNNLIAHLAGALGKRVWIILPYSANWRWFNGKNPCPWYNSAKIFKQKIPGEWQPLFREMNTELILLSDRQLEKNSVLASAG